MKPLDKNIQKLIQKKINFIEKQTEEVIADIQGLIKNDDFLSKQVKLLKTIPAVRWLIEDIVKELGETPFFRSSDLFEQIVMELIKRPRVLIVDEIDYLATDKCAVEMLRGIHDRTHNPIVLIEMSMADKKLKRYKHLYDRFSEILHFESFSIDDVKFLISELSEIKIADEVIQNIYQTKNRFRQIVKLINKAETIAQANDLSEVGLKELNKFL